MNPMSPPIMKEPKPKSGLGILPFLGANWRPIFLTFYLVSPILVRVGIGRPHTLRDPLIEFNIAATVLWALIYLFISNRPLIIQIFMIPLYFTTAVDLHLLLALKTNLTSNYLLIAYANTGNAGEFLRVSGLSLVVPALLFICASVASLWGARRFWRKSAPAVSAVAAITLVAMYGLLWARSVHNGMSRHDAYLDLLEKEQSAPFGVLFQLAAAVDLRHRDTLVQALRGAYHFDAHQLKGGHAPDLVVWVIGESSRPQNWSLFGYGRETNPLLEQRKDIIPLNAIRTTAPITSVAVPSMLSLRPISDWRGINATKSITSAFQEAGYQTAWISAQPCDIYGGIIPLIATEAEDPLFIGRPAMDEEVIPALDRLLAKGKPGEKLFVVVHLMGSHFEYTMRYPNRFNHFSPNGTSRKETIIASYDNSILYTDYVINGLIDEIGQRRSSSMLIYASDHGENLWDDDRQFWIHGNGTRFDLSTSALLWFSAEVLHDHKQAIEEARKHANDPFDISYLSHSVMDLANIQARELHYEKSIFNKSFKLFPYVCRVRGHFKTILPGEPLDASELSGPDKLFYSESAK